MLKQGHKTQGQMFLEVLKTAGNDKNKMFTLLCSTLEKSNPFPSEKIDFSHMISQIKEEESLVALNTTKAGLKAWRGDYMFADDYIYLTAKAYKDQGLGDIKNFKTNFKQFTMKEAAPVMENRPQIGRQAGNSGM